MCGGAERTGRRHGNDAKQDSPRGECGQWRGDVGAACGAPGLPAAQRLTCVPSMFDSLGVQVPCTT